MSYRYFKSILIILLSVICTPASAAVADSLRVSIITCFPGADIYALCGHTAVRVRNGEQMDSVWNYGLFDFSQDDFIYRFVTGETDYVLGGYPFVWFMPEYINRGSKVVEQELDLTQAEARKLLNLLRTESLPQNRTYRYNYVLDNCATRPLVRLDSAVSNPIIYPDTLRYGTFRREMRHYHNNYPWYQFGIDLVLGSGLDRPITPRQEMFVPVELMRQMEGATFPDGRPVVRSTRILNDGTPAAILPPTPWWLTPLFIGWAFFAIAAATAYIDFKRQRTTRLIYSLYWMMTGIAGAVVWFLTFFSAHEATSPNLLMWWLNPLMAVAAICVWIRRAAAVTNIMAWAGAIIAALLLLLWPFQPQSTAPAVFPLLGTGVALGAVYAINYSKISYKKRTTATRRQPTKRTATGRRNTGRRTPARRLPRQ